MTKAERDRRCKVWRSGAKPKELARRLVALSQFADLDAELMRYYACSDERLGIHADELAGAARMLRRWAKDIRQIARQERRAASEAAAIRA